MARKLMLAPAAVVVVLAGAAFAGIALWFHDGPGITKANHARIENGMREDQVQTILGGTPVTISYWGDEPFPPVVKAWFRDDGAAVLVAFKFERVTATRWCESRETTIEMFQRWFRRATFQRT